MVIFGVSNFILIKYIDDKKMSIDLAKKTGRSIVWNFTNQIIQQMMNILVVMVLARLLTPGDFGIFAMVVIFSNLAEPFREWGFQAYLIQKKDIDREYEDTAFWSICAIGMLLFVLGVICAPFVGSFFNNHEVAKYVRALSIVFLISPLSSVQWALACRAMDFRIITIRDLFGALVYGCTVCLLAFNGFGVWSMVIACLCRELIFALVYYLIHYWRPRIRFSPSKFKEMLGFSIHCMSSGVLKFFTNNIDNILVGKLLGATDLGLYNLAFNTVSLPQVKLVAHINAVAFPAFSSIQNDKERLRNVYLKSLRMVLLLVVPLLSILFITAKNFVLVFYGEKWLSAVLPIQIMCLYGLIRSLNATTETVFLSIGRPDIQFKMSLLRLVIFVVFLFFGMRYGIVGVSIAVLLYSLVVFYPSIYFCNRLLAIRSLDLCSILLRYLGLSLSMITAIVMLNIFIIHTYITGSFMQIMSDVLAGFLVFILALKIFFPNDLKDAIQFIRKVVA